MKMDWILQYSLIFFDFDGLLVNTEHLHYQAYRHMLAARGFDLPWSFLDYTSHAHKNAVALRQGLINTFPPLKEIPWALLYREKKQHYQELLSKSELEMMPGAEAILTRVQGEKIPHAVVTNSNREEVTLIQTRLPILQTIPTWITREEYTHPKPSPDAYQKGIERLGGAQEKMIGFEDTLRGIQALEGAQITPVLICSPKHPQIKEREADSLLYFPSF